MPRQPKAPAPAEGQPQQAATPEEVRGKLTQEYVGMWEGSLVIHQARTLTPLDPDFYGYLSDDIIQMMLSDAVIASDELLLIENVLADGGQMVPVVTDEEQPDYALAQDVSQFCADAIEQMDTDPTELFEQMLEARRYGYRVAEVTYKPLLNGAQSKLTLKSIKVRSRSALQFVMDEFANLLGFTTGYVVDSALRDGDKILPRVKFFLFTYRKTNEDPRGQQAFKAMFTAWHQKVQVWPILLRFLKLFAVPGIVGKPSKDSKPTEAMRNSDGEVVKNLDGRPVTITREEAMRNALLYWENSTVLVVAPGSEVDLVEPQTEGKIFFDFFRFINEELTKGQLHATRATTEAQHGSKADSETATNLVSTLVLYLKQRLAAAFRRDVLKVLVELNFGPDVAQRLTPYFQFGDNDRYNWASDAQAVTSFYGKLTDSQWDFLTASVGIPAPLEGEERPSATPPQPMPGQAANEPPAPGQKPKSKTPGQADKAPGSKPTGAATATIEVRDVLQRRTVTINRRAA